ncbi:hypothetical protein GCM10027258_92910 [Amycolatopsis stemonae]
MPSSLDELPTEPKDPLAGTPSVELWRARRAAAGGCGVMQEASLGQLPTRDWSGRGSTNTQVDTDVLTDVLANQWVMDGLPDV